MSKSDIQVSTDTTVTTAPEKGAPFDEVLPSKPSRFKVHNRVRVKFGIDRGHYGTITHVGGDDGTYYGVKLDCHDKEVGYSEDELDPA